MKRQITANELEMFQYLNALRESGEINMLGAAPHLRNAFGMTGQESRKVLSLWMTNFQIEWGAETMIKESV